MSWLLLLIGDVAYALYLNKLTFESLHSLCGLLTNSQELCYCHSEWCVAVKRVPVLMDVRFNIPLTILGYNYDLNVSL